MAEHQGPTVVRCPVTPQCVIRSVGFPTNHNNLPSVPAQSIVINVLILLLLMTSPRHLAYCLSDLSLCQPLSVVTLSLIHI